MMTLVGIIFTKETDNFAPILDFKFALKVSTVAFALTIAGSKSINRAIMRIYSVMCTNFFDADHFWAK